MAGEREEAGRVIGRYALHAEIASGGMARVHLGRLVGPVGFARTVAIKRLHSQYASDPEFVAMFLDEARVAARIRHNNVVPILDVVALQGEIFLVMEYVRGESLSRLLLASAKNDLPIAPEVIATIMIGALEGLHAAHEARNERGAPLQIVHRDVSPANVIIGDDGIPRVLDFGIAKASGRIQTTRDGQLKGKLAYMAPEQIDDLNIDRRADIWAASVVLWEMLTRTRLFASDNHLAIIRNIMEKRILPPSRSGAETTVFDAIVERGLARDPKDRFQTAREMSMAIEATTRAASARSVGEWVEAMAGDALLSRASMVKELESSTPNLERPVRDSSLTLRGRIAAALGDAAIPALKDGGNGGGTSAATPNAKISSDIQMTAEMPLSGPPATMPLTGPSRPVRTTEAHVEVVAGTVQFAAPLPRGSTLATTRKTKRHRPLSSVIFFFMGLVVILAIWGAARHYTGSQPTPSGTATVAAAAPSSSFTVTPLSEPSASLVAPGASAAATPSAPAASSAAPPRSATPKGRRPVSSPACNPPYTIGPPPDFIKHPKPECY